MKSGRRHLTAITAIGNMAKSSSITTLHVGGKKPFPQLGWAPGLAHAVRLGWS